MHSADQAKITCFRELRETRQTVGPDSQYGVTCVPLLLPDEGFEIRNPVEPLSIYPYQHPSKDGRALSCYSCLF